MVPIVKTLQKRGCNFSLLPGDKLAVKPLNLLTETDKTALGQQKTAIIRYLRSLPEDPALPILREFGWAVKTISDNDAARAAVVGFLGQGEEIFGLDIETWGPSVLQGKVLFSGGLDPWLGHIRTVQIAGAGNVVAVFDLAAVDPLILSPLFHGQGRFIAHNAGFEYRFLNKCGLRPQRLDCSMLMARLVYGLGGNGMKYPSLQETCNKVLGVNINKEVRDSDWGMDGPLSAAQIHYAALDAVLARMLAGPLKEALEKTGQTKAYRLSIRALPVVHDVMLDGIHFDRWRHAELTAQWERLAERAAQEVARALPEIRNPNSAIQLAGWLEKSLPSDLKERWPRTDTGNLKTGGDALAEWPDCPSALMEYKEFHKLSTTYGAGFAEHIHPVTGRIHSNFSLIGTSGGRFSCSSPNIQNPPRRRDFRELFIPGEGYEFVVADFSQIELRVCAIVAEDETMQRAYRDGVDLHRLTAATAAGISIEEVTSEQRQAAKAINFGLIYGMSAATLVSYSWTSYRVRMTLDQAERFRRAFFELYRGIARWHQSVKRGGRLSTSVRTRGGLLRDMGQETSGWKFTNACNTPVQGSAAEVLLASLARLSAELQRYDAGIVNHVHDEILLECLPEDVDVIKQILVSTMTEGFLDIFPDYPEMTRDLVEAHAGPNWYAAKSGGS
jgi:DNA polymerase-1